MKFWIRGGLGGGFGGLDNAHWVEIEADDEESADAAAYGEACEAYAGFAGMHGIRSVSEIMEQDDLAEEEAEDVYNEERESWLVYEATDTRPDELRDDGDDFAEGEEAA